MGGRDREQLRTAAHAVLRDDAGAVAWGRLCPACGSSGHGRPWARTEQGPLHVSLSYDAGLVLVGWSASHPLGLDVTPEGDDPGDALAWARAEALLKLTGEGVRGDPTGRRARTSTALDAPAGRVAWLATEAPLDRVSWRWAGPAAPARRATR